MTLSLVLRCDKCKAILGELELDPTWGEYSDTFCARVDRPLIVAIGSNDGLTDNNRLICGACQYKYKIKCKNHQRPWEL